MRRRPTQPPSGSGLEMYRDGTGIRAGARRSPAGVNLQRRSIAGFDFMEDRPLNNRGNAGGGNQGGSGGPGSGRESNRVNRQGQRMSSLFELLQELSVPPTPQRNLRGQLGSKNTPGGREPANGGVAEGRRLDDRQEADNAGSRMRQESVYGQHNLAPGGPLRLPPRPTLRRIDPPASVLSNRTRRVTFVGTAETRHEKKAHLAGNIASPTPSAKSIHKQRIGATAAFSISRPALPSGIGGGGGGAGCAGSRGKTPDSAATKRRTLGSIPPENFSGPSGPLHPSTASSTRLAAVKPADAVVATVMEADGEERPARRRRLEAERTDSDRGCRDADTCSDVDEIGGGRRGVATTSEQRFRREVVAENGGTTRYGERNFGHMSHVGMDDAQWTRPPGKVGSDGDQWLTQGDADILVEGNSQWLTQDETGGGVWMSQDDTVNNDQRKAQTAGGDGRRRMSWRSQARGAEGIQSTTQGSQREDQRAQNADKGRHVNGRAADHQDCQVTGSGDEGFPKREVEGPSGDREWACDFAANEHERQDEGDAAGPQKDLVGVRGLCRMRGAVLALVEWKVWDSSGAACTELSFMLASTLKVDWPQHYIAYLEEKLIFLEDDVNRLPGPGAGGLTTTAAGGTAGSELVVWKSEDSTGGNAIL